MYSLHKFRNNSKGPKNVFVTLFWTNILTHKINKTCLKRKKKYLIVTATEKGYVEIQSNHLRHPGVDGRIILRWIFRKWDVGLWTGSSWFRIGKGGGHL